MTAESAPSDLGSQVEFVDLAGPTDLAGFRQNARRLALENIPPERITWRVMNADALGAAGNISGGERKSQSELDLADEKSRSTQLQAVSRALSEAPDRDSRLRVPASFMKLCGQVLLHRDPSRFDLMYRLLWRLQREPALRHDPLDGDMMRANKMAQAVRRDVHKMRAFVRFTEVHEDGEIKRVAWFEPDHFIVEANAPFFVRRFAQMRWIILTPDLSVEWNGEKLVFGPPASREDKPPADASEHLWLAYYRSTFNPARPKFAMMVREMPRRYWPNLPEAQLIAPLYDEAVERSTAMLQAPATVARPMKLLQPMRPVVSGDKPVSLDDLRAATNACSRCPIGAGATQAVCGEGPTGASHMLVGEQPGDREDLAGRPFVGPAGQLLNAAMKELDWARPGVYMANAVKHFKYELRGKKRIHKTASQQEAMACAKWLDDEIDLVQPAALIALGATAARSLLGRHVAVMSERGEWIHERADGRPVLVTLHPSALLRMDDARRSEVYPQWLGDLEKAMSL